MSPLENKKIRCILLDIDGTLLDSNAAHAHAWADALSEAGYSVPYDAIRRRIGMGGDHLLAETIGIEKSSEEGKQLSSRYDALFHERYIGGVRPFPMVRELLEKMAGHGLMLVVATSATAKTAHALLEIAGATDLVDKVTTSADAPQSKPDPDIIQAALDAVQVHSQEALLLGDTPFDIEAAQNAGVPCIAVCSGGWEAEKLRDAGAIAVYRDVAQILSQFDDTAFGQAHPVGG